MYNQIVNKKELCLIYSNDRTQLTELDPHIAKNQEWACGGSHLIQPSKGSCLSRRSLPTDNEVDQLLLKPANCSQGDQPSRGDCPPVILTS